MSADYVIDHLWPPRLYTPQDTHYPLLLLLSHFSRVWLCATPQTAAHRPWDSPGKNTGVGCHFLLQCMKVKSESEVAQSCPTLSDPMGCSLPGSSVHGIFQARGLEWGAVASSNTLPTGGHISRRYIPSQAKLNIHFQKNVIGTLSYTIHKYTKINSKWIKN